MHRTSACLTALTVALGLGLACSAGGGGSDGATTQATACEAAAKTAQLYPVSAMRRTDTRNRVMAVPWARRDGGIGHHPPPKPWRRNTDLKFEQSDGALQVSYSVVFESREHEPESSTWTKACEICGDLLVCGDEVSTLRVRDGEVSGDSMTWLDTTEMVPVQDGGLYLIRYGHEVVLRFEQDPLSVDAGEVKVRMRKLAPGAKPSEAVVAFASTKRSAGDNRKQVVLELPDDVGKLRFDQRLDDKVTFLRGKGASKMLADVLFDGFKLTLSRRLGHQPSLD